MKACAGKGSALTRLSLSIMMPRDCDFVTRCIACDYVSDVAPIAHFRTPGLYCLAPLEMSAGHNRRCTTAVRRAGADSEPHPYTLVPGQYSTPRC